MNDTRMFIITHKVADIKIKLGYYPILVGADLKPEILDYKIKDNIGENISKKNPYYCELTGIYWVWKHVDSDIIGILHYRRYFSKKRVIGSSKYFISINEIEKIMNGKRVIMPVQKSFSRSVIQEIKIAPNLSDIQEMYEAIRICEPNYVDDYLWFLNQNKTYLFNMCIMKKNDFNAYCDWLFKILNYVESHHDIAAETDNYRKRLYGFLSERLIMVWIHHNISYTEIEKLAVINTEENNIIRVKHNLGNIKREILYQIMGKSVTQKEKNRVLIEKITKKNKCMGIKNDKCGN